MPERTAVYPGSFDPPTFGHIDLIKRAKKMFTNLIVAVAQNPRKKYMFTAEERCEMLRKITADIPDIEITSFCGLTAEFARERGAIAIVRGIRAMSDFEFEMTLAVTNQKLNPEADTVCLMPSEPHFFLSSRMVKEIAAFGGDTSQFVPPEVGEHLKRKLGQSE